MKILTTIFLTLTFFTVKGQDKQKLYDDAITKFSENKFNESLVIIDRILKIEPDWDYALHLKAQCFHSANESEKALKIFRKVIGITNDSLLKSGSYYEIAIIELDNSDSISALKDLTESLKLDKNNAEMLNMRADLLSKDGKIREAISDLTIVIQMDTNIYSKWDAYFRRAQLRDLLKDRNGACEDFKEFLKLDMELNKGNNSGARLTKAVTTDKTKFPNYCK